MTVRFRPGMFELAEIGHYRLTHKYQSMDGLRLGNTYSARTPFAHVGEMGLPIYATKRCGSRACWACQVSWTNCLYTHQGCVDLRSPLAKRKAISYGRKFRNRSGQTVRYVYKHRKKIGVVVLLAADVLLPDTEAELTRISKKSSFRDRVRGEINIHKAMYHHGTMLWVLSPKKK